MKTKINKKIFLQPHIPKKETECQCPTCGGIGFMLEDDKWLEQCTDCYNGIVPACEYCGSPMKRDPYSFKCSNPECNWEELDKQCRYKELSKKEKERVDKAKHYSLTDCPEEFCGMYFSESYGYNDGFFSDLEEIEEYCEASDLNIPKYIWGTNKSEFQLDAMDIIENKLEDAFEDVISYVDREEISKLQIACDNFVKAHDGCLDTYYINYNVCIDL